MDTARIAGTVAGTLLGGAVGGIIGFKEIGKGRRKANDFVQDYQNPFLSRAKSILDPFAAKEKAGTLTYDEAIQVQTDLEAEIADFQANANQFEGLGGEQKSVVGQARARVNPIVNAWRQSLTASIGRLPKPQPGPDITDLLKPPTLDTVTAREGTTPQLKAQGAADLVRKRALAARGRSSTILTGGGFAPVSTRQKTLLGY